jgi:hypothetical protein
MDREAEHVFNILNTMAILRNYKPMVCKFLDNMTAFFHVRLAAARRCSYVLERLGFRNRSAAAIGLPIAIPLQEARIPFRKGKG